MVVRRVSRVIALLALALCMSACVSDGGVSPMSGGATLAFDSVDGPPPQVFDRFVDALNVEAQTRSLPTISRDAQAAYRVRAYLAAQSSSRKTSIAWVFDVYDSSQQRTMRLSGEEPAGRPGRDAWAVADDHMLRRIAQNGMEGISALMKGEPVIGTPQPSTPRSPPPSVSGPAIANAAESANPAQTEPVGARAALAFGNQ